MSRTLLLKHPVKLRTTEDLRVFGLPMTMYASMLLHLWGSSNSVEPTSSRLNGMALQGWSMRSASAHRTRSAPVADRPG